MTTAAQDFVRQGTVPMIVGGTKVLASDGGVIDVHNPATGELLGQVPAATRADIDAAYDAAEAAFPAWSRTSAVERARLMHELADLIDAHGDELAALDVMDNGSPIAEMRKVNPNSTRADLLEARNLLQQRRPEDAARIVGDALAKQRKNLETLGLLAAIPAVKPGSRAAA